MEGIAVRGITLCMLEWWPNSNRRPSNFNKIQSSMAHRLRLPAPWYSEFTGEILKGKDLRRALGG